MRFKRKYINYYKEYQFDGGFTLEPAAQVDKAIVLPHTVEVFRMPWTIKLKKNECCIPCIRSRSMSVFMIQPTIIDYDYNGELVKVVVYNMTNEPHMFKTDMVQLVVFKIPRIKGSVKKRE